MARKGEILLHTCCAVCFEAVYGALCEEGYEVTAFFYNPNIHPYREFRKRLRAVEVATEARKVKLAADGEYGLRTYLEKVLAAGGDRCEACYRLRLGAAAEAAAGGAGVFTTTLLASPHQKHDVVAAEGRRAARAAGVEFFYCDWRDRMPMGVESARRKSLYRQHYCGCIWSEYERFHMDGKGAGE